MPHPVTIGHLSLQGIKLFYLISKSILKTPPQSDLIQYPIIKEVISVISPLHFDHILITFDHIIETSHHVIERYHVITISIHQMEHPTHEWVI